MSIFRVNYKFLRFLRKQFKPSKDINPFIKRPFDPGDFNPVPQDWIIKSLDFIGIATGKAGTTWWWKLLLSHPQVKVNRLNKKGLHYFYHFKFNTISQKHINIYNQAFASLINCISGEWSNGYLDFPFVISNFAKTAPDAKLIMLVRNPIDCIISDLNQQNSVILKYLGLQKEKAYILITCLSQHFQIVFCMKSLKTC